MEEVFRMKNLDHGYDHGGGSGLERQETTEEIIEELRLKAGREISLTKQSMIENQSKVRVGETLHGKLDRDVQTGTSIYLSNKQSNTSAVQRIYKEGDRYFVETQTSIYELMPGFDGLHLENELGEITLPFDAKSAELKGESVDHVFKSQTKDFPFRINKPALQEILLEANGGNLFRAIHGRFMVLAKVGNIHVPFYKSTDGTGGKRAGEWYPFFGANPEKWLVKGSISPNGDMIYHPEISRVQSILNENLVFPDHYISQAGKFGTDIPPNSVEPSKVFFDMNDHFKYQNFFLTQYRDKESEFVERITGYNPEHVASGNGTVDRWVSAITSKI